MHIQDGIVFAGDAKAMLSVLRAHPLGGHKLRVTFSDGTQYVVNMAPLLDSFAFAPLRDVAIFNQVRVEYGVPVWCDGEIDIAPEWLYENGWLVEQQVQRPD